MKLFFLDRFILIFISIFIFFFLSSGDAPDDALRWLLSRIRSQPPTGLGLQANVKAHESTKRTAFYISAPFNM